MKLVTPISLALIVALISCTNKENQAREDSSTPSVEVHPKNQTLFNLIKEKDSLLFQIGFNQIDTLEIVKLTAADFEFYHDEHGIIETKSVFVKSINSLRELPFKTWRTLIDGSMEVFPLYKENGQVLYGAIQHGVHEFYQQIEGEDVQKTNTAKFTHLWMIENGDWKLKRVLSYDHQIPK